MASKKLKKDEKNNESQMTCGIIMPITDIVGYPTNHWKQVLAILTEVGEDLYLKTKMVSYQEGSGLIHKAIVENIFENDIVICDVSSKNPNVMFELGLRLAFDKPAIIIKDEKTEYTFDTGIIEHVSYPHTLRMPDMIEFKKVLSSKIKSTLELSKKSDYSVFLSHFGNYTSKKISEKEVDIGVLANKIDNLEDSISYLTSHSYWKTQMIPGSHPNQPLMEYLSMASKSRIKKQRDRSENLYIQVSESITTELLRSVSKLDLDEKVEYIFDNKLSHISLIEDYTDEEIKQEIRNQISNLS